MVGESDRLGCFIQRKSDLNPESPSGSTPVIMVPIGALDWLGCFAWEGNNAQSHPCVQQQGARPPISMLTEAAVATGKNVLQVAHMGAEVASLRYSIHSSQRGGVAKTLEGRGIGPVRVFHPEKV